jgi:predicted  nucleic acid-binding Zn-ribbon protein
MQKIDDKIADFEIKKNKLPQQLDQLIASVNKADEALKAIEKSIETNALNQKTKENEIKSNNELKLKYGHQLDGIKNNKEYKALNSQISSLEEKNKAIETEILTIMEEETALKKQKEEAVLLKKHADTNLKANEDILKKEIEKVNEEIERLKEHRTEYAKQLPMPLVKKYVQLIKNKNHKAVVFNSNNACSGCGFHIRPQILIELNDPNKIIYCENCGRILVRSLDT